MTKISPVNIFSGKQMIENANKEMARSNFKASHRQFPLIKLSEEKMAELGFKKPLLGKVVDFAKNNKKLMAIGAGVVAGVAAVTAVVVKAVQNHKQDK